jgi:hypothetical protein
MAVRLCVIHTRCTLLPRNIIILMFLVLSSVKRLSKPQGQARLDGLGKFKNHLIGSRTRDLLACSIVP